MTDSLRTARLLQEQGVDRSKRQRRCSCSLMLGYVCSDCVRREAERATKRAQLQQQVHDMIWSDDG